MITTIHEHTVDLSLLPERANILDLGCIGFLFTNHFRRLGHNVMAFDIQNLEGQYSQLAISDFEGIVYIVKSKDSQAFRIQKHPPTVYPIQATTIKNVGLVCNISFWDLIKMDIEGSEYEVIMSLDKAPAKQLSIEFHLHTGIYKTSEMNMMENKLKALGYEPVYHEYTTQHGAGYNYWDSLFVLK